MFPAAHTRWFLVPIAALTLTACSSLGFLSGKADMPNSGVQAKPAEGVVEFAQIFKDDTTGAEASSGLIALALDRLAGWAFGALRDAAVARLDKLAGEFTGGFEAEHSASEILPAAGSVNWKAVRGVRFAVQLSPEGGLDWATTLARVGLSPALQPYFVALVGDSNREKLVDSEYERSKLGNIWWREGELTTWVQFVTMELSWTTETAAAPQVQVLRVKNPKLTVWASEARLLNWPRHNSAVIKKLESLAKYYQQQLDQLARGSSSAGDAAERSERRTDMESGLARVESALGNVRASRATKPSAADGLLELLGSQFLKEHGLHVGVRLSFSGLQDRRAVDLGEVAWTFDGIWPMDTALGAEGELLPAYSVKIEDHASRWIPTASYQTVQIAVRESSDVEAWINAARDQVAGLEWDEIAGKEGRGRQGRAEPAPEGVVRSSLTPIRGE